MPAIERLIRRDRIVMAIGLTLVAAGSWIYVLGGAGMDMPAPPASGAMSAMMSATPAWSAGYALLMFAMWWVMMVAMMLPSAAPMILLFVAANRQAVGSARWGVPPTVFVSGYLAVWGLFSIAATAMQYGLSSARLLSPMMESSSLILGSSLLVAAGIYQLTPWKDACLRHCRSPLHHVMGGWRPGVWGAFRMGCEHGLFCLGCCWVLMGLLFYGGVMNIAWIGGLTIYILIEKMTPFGDLAGRFAGVILIAWGIANVWLAAAA